MEYDGSVTRRVKRLEGQTRGILKMMEDGKDCKEVISQLSAVRSAADKAIAYIVAVNLEQCIRQATAEHGDPSPQVREAVKLLIKSR
ncbi:metal-sensing transcriptional repressor [Paenibacillus sp. HJL G12]|uniref:Metal-sensing transcriptional repressor n=1 Tax=Paenibacillus dendrobii TaxID=2691084 RepID=A0A7X3LGC5_9BACL|nr:metal-sensitive transcriptional regulator [Paenibacillus dendrobii]MWV43055.1 metal-sensing transcriptional repressor [Paenibacillus dendrobii]